MAARFLSVPSYSLPRACCASLLGGASETFTATVKGTGIRPTQVAVEGLALHFPGDGNAYVEAPVDVSPIEHPQLTMGAWVKPLSWNSYLSDEDLAFDAMRAVLSSDNGGYDRAVGIRSQGVNAVGWAAFSGSADSAGTGIAHSLPIKSGEWSFVAVTYDQDAKRVVTYVDGERLDSALINAFGVNN